MTLEELLRTKVASSNRAGEAIQIVPDFRVAVQGERGGGVHFIIHPAGHSGETLDFVAVGDEIVKLN